MYIAGRTAAAQQLFNNQLTLFSCFSRFLISVRSEKLVLLIFWLSSFLSTGLLVQAICVGIIMYTPVSSQFIKNAQ
jgi:Na+/H+ antiporter NhaB